MTKEEAKELSLEVWRYLAAHGEITRKKDLPHELYEKIRTTHCCCPLCDLYHSLFGYCIGCPLITCGINSPLEKWGYAETDTERSEAATAIVHLIEAWEV